MWGAWDVLGLGSRQVGCLYREVRSSNRNIQSVSSREGGLLYYSEGEMVRGLLFDEHRWEGAMRRMRRVGVDGKEWEEKHRED